MVDNAMVTQGIKPIETEARQHYPVFTLDDLAKARETAKSQYQYIAKLPDRYLAQLIVEKTDWSGHSYMGFDDAKASKIDNLFNNLTQESLWQMYSYFQGSLKASELTIYYKKSGVRTEGMAELKDLLFDQTVSNPRDVLTPRDKAEEILSSRFKNYISTTMEASTRQWAKTDPNSNLVSLLKESDPVQKDKDKKSIRFDHFGEFGFIEPKKPESIVKEPAPKKEVLELTDKERDDLRKALLAAAMKRMADELPEYEPSKEDIAFINHTINQDTVIPTPNLPGPPTNKEELTQAMRKETENEINANIELIKRRLEGMDSLASFSLKRGEQKKELKLEFPTTKSAKEKTESDVRKTLDSFRAKEKEIGMMPSLVYSKMIEWSVQLKEEKKEQESLAVKKNLMGRIENNYSNLYEIQAKSQKYDSALQYMWVNEYLHDSLLKSFNTALASERHPDLILKQID